MKVKKIGESKFMDLTPTWEGILPAMLTLLKQDSTPFETVKHVESELLKMAKIADKYVESQKDKMEAMF